jgi:hypothetical protein
MMVNTKAVRFYVFLVISAFQFLSLSSILKRNSFTTLAFVLFTGSPTTSDCADRRAKTLTFASRCNNKCQLEAFSSASRKDLPHWKRNRVLKLQKGSTKEEGRVELSANISVMNILTSIVVAVFLFSASFSLDATASDVPMSNSASASTSTNTAKTYDGFASYAKENKMEQSDVKCFIQRCGVQTKALFANPRGIKGVACLGRCKGEQSDELNQWLSCTIEENECVKVPKSVLDNSEENKGYASSISASSFDPNSLLGTWYKTNGLNPNYDLFDCQTNVFTAPHSYTSGNNDQKLSELDMGIFFRVSRPEESGGGYWENKLTEHMVIDDSTSSNPTGRTMHTNGKMYGLQFEENWYILSESDGTDIPPYKLVAYKGHTLQGNYDGAFVYAKEPVLPEKAIPAIRKACKEAGLNFDDFVPINNSCPTSEKALNDPAAGTGTSATDWVNLVVGEGGVFDWINPGWRGEYNR